MKRVLQPVSSVQHRCLRGRKPGATTLALGLLQSVVVADRSSNGAHRRHGGRGLRWGRPNTQTLLSVAKLLQTLLQRFERTLDNVINGLLFLLVGLL